MTTITSADLDILRARMAAAIGGRMAAHIERLGWSVGQLAGWQRGRLQALLARATGESAGLAGAGPCVCAGVRVRDGQWAAFSPAGPTGATLVPAFRHAFLTAAAIAAITTPIARTIRDADAAATMRPREQNPAAPPPPAAVPPQIQEGTLDLGQAERPRAGAADGPGRIIQSKAAAHPISWACASGPWP